PMIEYAIRTTTQVTGAQPVVVVGHEGVLVHETLGAVAHFVWQHEQLGTGHAVLVARDALQKADIVIVLYGDTPFVKPETLQNLLDVHSQSQAKVSPLTVVSDDSMGFGRIIRNAHGDIIGIIEEAVATPAQLQIK